MPPDDIRCLLVKIHGIGNQPVNWSKDFDAALAQQLSPEELSMVAQRSVWWADLSQLPGTPVTRGPAPRGSATEGPTIQAAHQQASSDYARYLAGHAAVQARDATARGSILAAVAAQVMHLKDGPLSVADHIADVADYVAKNRIRLAIQQRLTAALFEMQEAHSQAALILAAHSQGTIIAYDVLRLLAARLPSLRVWVSMGCPLDWYLNGASWGDNEIELPTTMRWVNLYDPQDAVGRDLANLATWSPVLPEDINVDNVGRGLDAHDHWHNPVVVAKYAELIRTMLARR